MEIRKIKAANMDINDTFNKKLYESIHYFPEIVKYLDILVVTEDNYSNGHAIIRLIDAKIAAIGFNFERNVSYYTIGHELSHIIQGMNLVENGEATCDLLAFSRCSKFITYKPSYLSFGLKNDEIKKISKERIHAIAINCIKIKGLHKFSVFRKKIKNDH